MININALQPIEDGIIEDTDICYIRRSGANHDRTFLQVKDYIGGDTSQIANTDTFLFANSNTGVGKFVTGTQLKSWIAGSNTVIKDTDCMVVFHGSSVLKATGTEFKAYNDILPFTPTDLGEDLVAWYDISDASSLTTGLGVVTVVNDKSGNGLHLDTSGGNFPLYSSTGGAANKGYIKITSEREIFTNLSIPSAITIYTVYKYNAGSSGEWLACFDGSASCGMHINTLNGFNGVAYRGFGGGNAKAKNPSLNTGWEFLRFNYATSGSSGFHVNNIPLDITSYDAGGALSGSNIARLCFGWRAVQSVNIDFHEMIVIDGEVTPELATSIRGYIASKYNIISPNSMLFLGDSITYGAHASNVDLTSFASLACEDKGFEQINFAYPGSFVVQPNAYSTPASLSGANLVDKVLQLQDVPYDWSSIRNVFIAYATNDEPAADSPSNTSAWKARYKQAVQDVIDLSGLAPEKIILGTAPYQSVRALKLPTLNTAISEICDELGCIYCDFWTVTEAEGGDALLDDGTHPTDEGMQIMADVLIPLIN